MSEWRLRKSQRNSPDGSGRDSFVFGLQSDLLHCNNLSGLFVAAFVYDTVGALADLLDFLKVVHVLIIAFVYDHKCLDAALIQNFQ